MFRTADLLRANDHEVSFFAMQDPRNLPCAESEYFPRGRYYGEGQGFLRRASDAASSIYSVEARRSLRRLLREKRPDVAHLHNVYHQLTLSVVDELAVQGIPIVMTLHDYKPVCPSYVLYVDGAPCHRCVTGNSGHAIVHRCIKGSRAASTIGALESVLAQTRGTYDQIDAFIAPSRHLADVMVQGGFPSERMHVITNFVADEQLRASIDQGHTTEEGSGIAMVLFVGRLEEVKGVRVLLSAARELAPDVEVVIVGNGPLEPEVRDAERKGAVRYLGSLDWPEIARLMDEARALVVPSIWEENCPMVVLEAGARGCPVIASDRGGLVELVENGVDGLLVGAGDVGALSAAMLDLSRNAELSANLGEARYKRTLADHVSGKYLASVLDLYEKTRAAQ